MPEYGCYYLSIFSQIKEYTCQISYGIKYSRMDQVNFVEDSL